MNSGIRIGLYKPEYHRIIGSPPEHEIYEAINELKSESGCFGLSGRPESSPIDRPKQGGRTWKFNFQVDSAGDRYLVRGGTTDRFGRLDAVVMVDSRVTVPEMSEDYESLTVFKAETYKHNTVTNFDQVLIAFESYFKNHDYLDLEPYAWLGVKDDIHKSRF